MNRWSKDDEQRLVQLWNSGQSAGECARALNVSRSTVCAKVSRLRENGLRIRTGGVIA